jgi:hypothetical protein
MIPDMDKIVNDYVSSNFEYIKMMKPSMDDMVTLMGNRISVMNAEGSKLQNIIVPFTILLSIPVAMPYREIHKYMVGDKDDDGLVRKTGYIQYLTAGPYHHRAVEISNSYPKFEYLLPLVAHIENMRESFPDVMKMSTSSKAEIIQLQPNVNIMMIPGIFSAAAKDIVGVEVFDRGPQVWMVKFEHYKASVKTTINIYMLQLKV